MKMLLKQGRTLFTIRVCFCFSGSFPSPLCSYRYKSNSLKMRHDLTVFKGLMFGISGENLTARMRKDAFEAMLKQEIGWYDKVENNTGALCARLSGDAAKVQGATGARVGSIMQGIAGVLIAVLMGLYFNWKLGLVCSLFFPLLIITVIFEQRIIMGVDSVEKVAFEKSAKVNISDMFFLDMKYYYSSWP